MSPDAPRELHDLLHVAWRRRLLVAVVTAVVTGAALATSMLRTPAYRAEAELLVRQAQGQQIVLRQDVGNAAEAARALRNEVELLESDLVREAVAAGYEGALDVDDVDAAAGSDADVITLSVTAADPVAAAALLDEYARRYLEVRRAQQATELLAAGNEVRAQLDTVRGRIAELREPLDALDARLAQRGEPDAGLQSARDALADDLQPQLDALRAEESYFRQQLDQLQLTAQLAGSGGPQLLSSGKAPESPVSPRPARDAIVGMFLGVLLGVAMALVRDRLDDSVASKEQLERITDTPTLALVPTFATAPRVMDLDPASAAAEAYRSLRTSVKFLSLDRDKSVVQIVSSVASEGKTETAANLAVAMARAGEKVVVVGADLREPRLQQLFGVGLSPGFTDVLAGTATLADALVPIPSVPGLHVLPAGFPPPNPSELLGSERTAHRMRQLTEVFDLIVLDCAPVLPVTDSLVLSRLVDATIVVAARGMTTSRSLARAVEMLRQVGAPVVGTVFNRVPAGETYGGGKPYRYGGATTRPEVPVGRPRRSLRRRPAGVGAG